MSADGERTASPAAAVARVVLAVILPLVLILTNVRLLLTPTFVSIEYATPGFPDDPYGFTRPERIRLAQIARAYLLNDAGPEYLGSLQDAAGSLLYNPRELSHMIDVKLLVQRALWVWMALTAGLAVTGWAAWRFGRPGTARGGLNLGARLTLILMESLAVLLLASFSMLFTGFHQVFFQSGTWIFYNSDTLIRLFHMRFWRDVFMLLMILTGLEAGAILWITGRRPAPADDPHASESP